MGISILKSELVNCGSSDQSANLGLDFGTRSQVNNLVASNFSITAQNVVNMVNIIVCDMHCMKYSRSRVFTDPYSTV